jgi:AcrR family transcriptional regulator
MLCTNEEGSRASHHLMIEIRVETVHEISHILSMLVKYCVSITLLYRVPICLLTKQCSVDILATEHCFVDKEGIMSRVVKAPDVRRQELIEIALKQFLENGYEKTSVRSILKEAGGEIGMFYHYFKSKNEIYEAVLENYNEKYISKFTEIVNCASLSFEEKLNQILTRLPDSISEYSQMFTEKINPEIRAVLLSRTLLKMVPLFEEIILDGLEKNIMNAPVPNIHLLSQFMLFGMSAVIHDIEVKSMEEKLSHIKAFLSIILDTKLGEA